MHARKQVCLVGALLSLALQASAANVQADSVKQSIRYRVSSAVADLRRADNSEAMEQMEKAIRSVGIDRIRRITVVAWASPEGPLDLNIRLARQRAHAAVGLIIGKYPELTGRISESARGEGWASLRNYVVADGKLTPKEKDDIVSVIDANVSLTRKKEMMKRLPSYQYLLRNYNVEIRRADMTLYFDIEEEPKEIAVVHDTVYVEREIVRTDTVYWCPPERRKVLRVALKSNLLYDAALVPNIGLEIPVGNRWSVAGNWMYAWWKCDHRHNYWRTYGGDLEMRHWWPEGMNGRLTGHHVGVYGQMQTFDFETGHRGYLAPRWLWGGGVSYGYSTRLARRFNLDFTIGLGYLGGKYKEYLPIDGCYVWQRTRTLNYFGPTKVEATLVWLLNIKGGRTRTPLGDNQKKGGWQ